MQTLELLGDSKASIMNQLLAKPRTAVQLATVLKIQVSAVRKHLDQLEALEIIQNSFEHSNIGRPKKTYTLTTQGRELFPRRYDAIFNLTLAKLGEKENVRYVESLLGRVAGEMVKESFSDIMGRTGFQASVEDKGDSYLVTTRNCPLLKTAQDHRELVCTGLHAELLRKGLEGSKVIRDKWIVDGDPVCTHMVEKKKLLRN